MPDAVHIKTTLDGRKVEMIGRFICLDGRPEAEELVVIDEHPNRQAIQRAVPAATHVAGRLPLTLPEASVAQAALRRAQGPMRTTVQALNEHLRQAVWRKTLADGVE